MPAVHASRDAWERYRENIRRCSAAPLASFLRSADNPLAALLEAHGRLENEFIKSLHQGDIDSGNIIKQIFQEVYLGTDLFRSTYNREPAVYRGDGFILRERLLMDRSLLAELSAGNVLAVATGRPRAEAEYPLQHFKLDHFFSQVVTLDDCLREENRMLAQESRSVSLSKPHPFMLDAIAEAMGQKFACCYYVGDMPDDMLAAARSTTGYKGVGLLLAAPDRASLKREMTRAGADYIVESFDALKQIIL
jgi:phosphoglycolate phosphatase-like HAD superfamily hydrolase